MNGDSCYNTILKINQDSRLRQMDFQNDFIVPTDRRYCNSLQVNWFCFINLSYSFYNLYFLKAIILNKPSNTYFCYPRYQILVFYESYTKEHRGKYWKEGLWKQYCRHFEFSRLGFSNLGKRNALSNPSSYLLLNVLNEHSDKKMLHKQRLWSCKYNVWLDSNKVYAVRISPQHVRISKFTRKHRYNVVM